MAEVHVVALLLGSAWQYSSAILEDNLRIWLMHSVTIFFKKFDALTVLQRHELLCGSVILSQWRIP